MGLFGGKDGVTSGMKPGFRDFKWGDVPTPRMQVLDEHAESKFCWIPDDELSWDGAPLDRVVYEFWENRLAQVHVEIPAASADKMLKDLHASWGKSKQPNKFIEDFVWQNKAAGPEATNAVFSQNPSTQAATLRIQSSYIQTKRMLLKGHPPAR